MSAQRLGPSQLRWPTIGKPNRQRPDRANTQRYPGRRHELKVLLGEAANCGFVLGGQSGFPQLDDCWIGLSALVVVGSHGAVLHFAGTLRYG